MLPECKMAILCPQGLIIYQENALKLYNEHFEQIDEKKLDRPIHTIIDFNTQLCDQGVLIGRHCFEIDEKIIDFQLKNGELLVMTPYAIYYLDRKDRSFVPLIRQMETDL